MNSIAREHAILDAADSLLRDKTADRVKINSVFYYSFHPSWVTWVEKARQELFRQSQPLNETEGRKWATKIRQQLETILWPDEEGRERAIAPRRSEVPGEEYERYIIHLPGLDGLYIMTATDYVDEITEDGDPDLWARLYEPNDGRPLLERRRKLDEVEQRAISSEKLYQIMRIIRLIYEVEDATTLFDLGFDTILQHIVYGTLPKMRDYGGKWYRDPRTGGIDPSVLRFPAERPKGKRGRPSGQPGMDTATVVRTWAIFLLSKKGGGSRSQGSAKRLWNERFPRHGIELDSTGYIRDLNRMFPQKSRAGNTSPPPKLGPPSAEEIAYLVTLLEDEATRKVGQDQVYISDRTKYINKTFVPPGFKPFETEELLLAFGAQDLARGHGAYPRRRLPITGPKASQLDRDSR